jgi:diadenosine tetraphosphatase ApaH/serine/threonine PP2A family protein phosphatase
VHASPGRDDGPGIENDAPDDELLARLGGTDADVIVGGHTHDPTDRMVGRIRALNPGSTGLPRGGRACWMLVEATRSRLQVTRREVDFDIDAVATDLHQRRYPTAEFVEAILRRNRTFVQ